MVEIITNPVEALVKVGKENSELHEELKRIQNEHYWLVKGLEFISQMPNDSAEVAKKVLQFRPYRS